jgi:HEAT repeat protein
VISPGGPALRDVVVAGHTGDLDTAQLGLQANDPSVRAAALGALHRLDALDQQTLAIALTDVDAGVRRRAAELAAAHATVDLLDALGDTDARVVEVAAWACGERETSSRAILDRLIALAGDHDDPLVREAAVAALGAIGDERAVVAIVAATGDKPAVRRRAVLALAPFEGAAVDAALQRALADRDWQVRQAAEDLLRAQRDP